VEDVQKNVRCSNGSLMERAKVCKNETSADVLDVKLFGSFFLCEAKDHLEVVFWLIRIFFWRSLQVFHSFSEERLEGFVDLVLVDSTGQSNEGTNEITDGHWKKTEDASNQHIEVSHLNIVAKI